MARILIVDGRCEGQTRKIATRIAQRLQDQKHQVEVVDGAPVRMLKYPRPIIDFVKSNRAFLERVPSAFFSVCMAAASPLPDKRQQAQTWNERFFNETGWHPRMAPTFAGALRYRQYNFLLRIMIKRIARAEGVSTDTSRDHEYTDWVAVARFADEFSRRM